MLKLKYVHILFICFLSVAALHSATQDATPKTVTLNAEQLPLRLVLRSIADQTDAKFVFCDDLVDNRHVSCAMEGFGLDQALTCIFRGSSLQFQHLPGATVVIYTDAASEDPDIQNPDAPFNANSMRPPVLRDVIAPDYPLLAKNEGLEGRVEIQMLVSGE